MNQAWPRLRHVFSLRRHLEDVPKSNGTIEEVKQCFPNFPKQFLNHFPVDLLVVECCSRTNSTIRGTEEPWERAIAETEIDNRPLLIVESWAPNAVIGTTGPDAKIYSTRWKTRGYRTHIQFIPCETIGGSIKQDRTWIVRERLPIPEAWSWSIIKPITSIRPMSNLLTPPGLGRFRYFSNNVNGKVWNAATDLMPSQPGSRIRTEKGIRNLRLEEVGRALGFDKEAATKLKAHVAKRTTAVHHWEYIGRCMPSRQTTRQVTRNLNSQDTQTKAAATSDVGASRSYSFEWKPPSLKDGSKWNEARKRNLRRACDSYPNSEEMYRDGLQRLSVHRNNYNKDGPCPKRLQLLWWEFPREHWDELREGFRQRFLTKPTPTILPNAEMDESGLSAATEFVEELIQLGVLREGEGIEVLSNAPLFVVAKAGQPGQWRVIADMKKGGQNDAIGADPCFLPRANHILEELYTGGYSAVVDLSKYFYNYQTHPEDRPYLGMIHPITGVMWVYHGLPMGSSNSPAASGRGGNAFLRKLRQTFETFQGRGRANCYFSSITKLGYNPRLGYGYILKNDKYGVAVKIWGFVDDFFIHGLTLKAVREGLKFFLDAALECGFLAHPGKLTKPSQEVKYIGFNFNTVDEPILSIPTDKRERALAMCDYLLSDQSKEWSRLGLAVVAGVLESLSDATPKRYGHTVLREFHTLVHPPGMGTGMAPYITRTKITQKVYDGIRWWKTFLKSGQGRIIRPQRAGTLVTMFGDGSGTGTGGTLQIPESPLLMWSAVWNVTVFAATSNYKELNTLRLSLLHLERNGEPSKYVGTTVFYFTDNSTTYFIMNSGSSRWERLHALIVEIKLLELRLEINLVVIHVPGKVMITQGTDGLSRGVWMSQLHQQMDQQTILAGIFSPVAYHPELFAFARTLDSTISSRGEYLHWESKWSETACFDHLTIWCPPPEICRQLLYFLMNMWVERPFTTSCLIFVPRTCSASYLGLSRYIRNIGTIKPHEQPLRYSPLLPIPIEIFYIKPHVSELPNKNRRETFSHPELLQHRKEAEEMRWMSALS